MNWILRALIEGLIQTVVVPLIVERLGNDLVPATLVQAITEQLAPAIEEAGGGNWFELEVLAKKVALVVLDEVMRNQEGN